MDDRTLLKILRDEEADAAAYYSSELAEVQAEAMRRYHAEKYGDEAEGRSQVVTHDVEDTINWIMPALMRFLLSSDELITVDDDTTDDVKHLKDIAAYISHLFFKKNDGETLLHDFVFDGLLQRIGCAKVTWEDPKPEPPKKYEGVSPQRLQQFVNNPEYEIIGQDEREDGRFDLEVRRTKRSGVPVVTSIPPEEYSFARRSRTGATADYKNWRREVFLADLISEYPDSKDELQDPTKRSNADDDHYGATDDRLQERFPDENDDDERSTDTHHSRRKVWLSEEEIRIDFDDDNTVELRSIKRVGNVLLENEVIPRTQFYSWSPIRVAHRMAGRSITDTLIDIQRIRTVVTRRTLDCLSQSLLPRTVVNTQKIEDHGIDALLDADVGGVVEVSGDVREAVMPLVTPDITASGYQTLEYWDQRSEEASGVTRHAQGLKAEAITDTADGITKLQAAANARVELIARWLGKSVEEIFQAMLELVRDHQDEPASIKVRGKPIQVDPSAWSDDMTVEIHIGMAAETRESKLQHLGVVAQKQEQILLEAGESNPAVSWKEYRDTLGLMTETMGFKSPERFFKEIPEDYQPPEPGPDPAEAEAQAKLQLEQQKAQQTQQAREAELQHKAQMDQANLQLQREIAVMKAQSDRELAEMRIRSESELAVARMQGEMQLAQWKAQQEYALKRDLGEMSAAASANGSNGSSGISGGRPGGRLDQ